MQQAQSAQSSGQRERARQAWRSAAKAYPTQKSPWQSLAQDYFDASDYGNAILAAQEVLQRDSDDTLAHSVLAVSGLRLSTVSMIALRERGSYAVGSRDEAIGLTRAMREALDDSAATAAARPEAPARSAAPPPVAAAKPAPQQPVRTSPAAASAPTTAPPPAATTAVATPAVNAVPGTPRSASRPGATAVVPVAATPAATSTPVPATTPRPVARNPVPGPAPKAAAAPTPKPASADPFKLLN